MKGYKGMLRDRIPKVVDYALKWQKAKERWIDHSYKFFIKIIGEELNVDDKIIRTASENKRAVISILLGMKKGKPKHFNFDYTIDWENLTKEETVYWTRVSSWVRWFVKRYAYIENTYLVSKQCGKDDFAIKVEIINTYLTPLLPDETETDEEKKAKYKYVDNLVDYLVNCFKK